ncbi:MAG: 2-phospho-L-lactate transferase [Anaerolineae bacterium]|nr:2-phospho-L-lactate transferase [Anaerolineae bacterium]
MAVKKVVALAGGVGGAKLAYGLAKLIPELTVIVNVGDDFTHYGLHISPDLDTVMYTLADIANPQTGWGLLDESWQMLGMLERYGETPWFRLGDKDLATHLLRTHRLQQGETLTEVVRTMSQMLNIQQTILPATNDQFATMVDTLEEGTLPFQHYFVRHRWQPTATRIWYNGSATITTEVVQALEKAEAIVICPSNPILSIDPILTVGDIRERLRQRAVLCAAVSPLIQGQAVKGPADKIMRELGFETSSTGIATFYDGLIDVLFVDQGDAPRQGRYLETDIMMSTVSDRVRLAKEILEFLEGKPL